MASNIYWPSSLPQQFLIDGYDEKPPNFSIRTEMEAAVSKTRPRFSTGSAPFSGMMLMSNAQYLVLKDFYRVTLRMGSLEFNMPVIGDSSTFQLVRFMPEAYNPSPHGLQWDVKLNLELLP